MFIPEDTQRITIFSRANFIKLGVAVLVIWFVILLCANSLTHSIEPSPSLIHDNGRLIVPKDSPLRHAITIKKVIKQALLIPFTLPATVAADPARLLTVQSPVTGQIIEINKKLGDYVTAGDALYSIRSTNLVQVVSDAQKAEAEIVFAKQNFERQKALIESKISSMHDVQQAKNDYEQAMSELARTKALLSVLHASQTINTDNPSVLTVRSPTSGYITELNATLGGYWNDTTRPVLTVADLTSVYIIANLQEKDIETVFIGQPVTIIFDAYSKPVHSKVDYINPILNPDTRTMDVGILYKNKEGLLKPNMFAKAQFISRARNRILLPLTAVIQRGFDSIVFVEVSDWVFEPRVVHAGPQLNDSIEIVSGLAPGERVAQTGGIILND
jgi:membrane fusion protein, heavy metal efflux system